MRIVPSLTAILVTVLTASFVLTAPLRGWEGRSAITL